MTKQYLDKSGLTYFYGKVKDKLPAYQAYSTSENLRELSTGVYKVTANNLTLEYTTNWNPGGSAWGTYVTISLAKGDVIVIQRKGTPAISDSEAGNYVGDFFTIEGSVNKSYKITNAEPYSDFGGTGYIYTWQVDDLVQTKVTKTSELTNDSGFITNSSLPDMSNYLAKNNTTAFTPTGDYQPATKKYVDDNAGAVAYDSLPVGTIVEWTTNTVPTNYLLCNGQAVSKNVYHDLYAVIGDTYGASGNTFNLPNLKGRVPVGRDTSQNEFYVLGTTGGEKTHTLQISEMPSHNHTVSHQGYYSTVMGDRECASRATISGDPIDNEYTCSNTGGGQAHNNLQPYIVVNYIIKAQPSAVNTSEVVNEHSTSETNVYSANQTNAEIENAVEDVYSTSETLTNKKWQGLPVYRKLINLPSVIECTENSWVSVLDVSSYNINNLVKVIAISTNNCVWNGFLTRINNNQLQFFNGITGWNVSILVLEYTKNN